MEPGNDDFSAGRGYDFWICYVTKKTGHVLICLPGLDVANKNFIKEIFTGPG
jgi:hypothetical protein